MESIDKFDWIKNANDHRQGQKNRYLYEIFLFICKNQKNRTSVRLFCPGYWTTPIHRCYPTTVQRGNFCLLCLHPGPIRSSLLNLVDPNSSELTILTPSLARTPDRHSTPINRSPRLKPFDKSSFEVTRLQVRATALSW